jgi:hypothetical protein
MMDRMRAAHPWYVEDLPAFAFLPHAHNGEFLEDERIAALLAEWMVWFPTVFSCQMVAGVAVQGATDAATQHCAALQDGSAVQDTVVVTQDNSWGLMVDVAFALEHGLPLDEPVVLTEAGRHLIYYQTMDLGDDENGPTVSLDDIVSAAVKTAHDNGLGITGSIYHRIVFHSHEEGRHILNSVLSLPLS